jgi:lipopolysaccharide transport system ATP-binding protein
MSDIAVSVENLSKRYLIGHETNQRQHYAALRDVIGREARNFLRKAADLFCGRQIVQGDEVEEFWALRDVSFEVKRGEVLGIIGRNGAGKSTLLKILSRITAPTEGRVRLRGRVGSLLEVGTGFHPELTGRENIFLNGAILGMTRAEITRKFDEIVAFAEIEQFLDTPVKRYSSGMYVRLAFAVAAHLEPEILIVDEVLAVGDVEFQKKCLGKIDEVSRREGRTVIFVSHNMSAVNSLCSKGLLLNKGQVREIGDTKSVVSKYLTHMQTGNEGQKILVDGQGERQQRPVYLTSVSILDHEHKVSSKLEVAQPFHVCLNYTISQKVSGVEWVLRIDTYDGIAVFSSTHPSLNSDDCAARGPQVRTYYVKIPAMFLMPGSYFVTIAAHTPMVEVHDLHEQVLGFEIVDTGSPFAVHGSYRKIGIVMVDLAWNEVLGGQSILTGASYQTPAARERSDEWAS